jgi:hypothetical protein
MLPHEQFALAEGRRCEPGHGGRQHPLRIKRIESSISAAQRPLSLSLPTTYHLKECST